MRKLIFRILFILNISLGIVLGIDDEVCSIAKYMKDFTKDVSEESLLPRKRTEWSKLKNLASSGIDIMECYKLKKSHSVIFGSTAFKFENYLFDKNPKLKPSQGEKNASKKTAVIDQNLTNDIKKEHEESRKGYRNDSIHDTTNTDKNAEQKRVAKIADKEVKNGTVISKMNDKHGSKIDEVTKLNVNVKPIKKVVNKSKVSKDESDYNQKQMIKETSNVKEEQHDLESNDDKKKVDKDEKESGEIENSLEKQQEEERNHGNITKMEITDDQSQDNHEIGNATETDLRNQAEEKKIDFEQANIPTEMTNKTDTIIVGNNLIKGKSETNNTAKNVLDILEISTNPKEHSFEIDGRSSEEIENIERTEDLKSINTETFEPSKINQLESLKGIGNKDSAQVIDDKAVTKRDTAEDCEIKKMDKSIIDLKSQPESLLETHDKTHSETNIKMPNEKPGTSNKTINEISQETAEYSEVDKRKLIERVQNDVMKKEMKKEPIKNSRQHSKGSSTNRQTKTNSLKLPTKSQIAKTPKSIQIHNKKHPITDEKPIKNGIDTRRIDVNKVNNKSRVKSLLKTSDDENIKTPNNTKERPTETLSKPSKDIGKIINKPIVKGKEYEKRNNSSVKNNEYKTISQNSSNHSFAEKKSTEKEHGIKHPVCKSKVISNYFEFINYYKNKRKVQKDKIEADRKSINNEKKFENPSIDLEQFLGTINSHSSELIAESEKRFYSVFSGRLSQLQNGISRLESRLKILDKKLKDIVIGQNRLDKRLTTIERLHSQSNQRKPLLMEIKENLFQLINSTKDLLMEKQKEKRNVIYPENPKVFSKNVHPKMIFLSCQFYQIVGFKICCEETKGIPVRKRKYKPKINLENLKHCYDVQKDERIVNIIPNGNKNLKKECLCRNKSLVIMQRRSGNVNFTRKWNEYKYGFGKLFDSFWIGLEFIHQLTKSNPYKLYIHMKDWDNNTFYAIYDQFRINSESNGYQLNVKGYSGNSGDSLVHHNGKKFSTIDVDHDEVAVKFGGSCSNRFRGGWWYYSCYKCNPTGVFYEKGEVAAQKFDGISWKTLRPPNYSFQEFSMSITSLK